MMKKGKNKGKKRILAIVLSFVFVMTVMKPWVYAQDKTVSTTTDAESVTAASTTAEEETTTEQQLQNTEATTEQDFATTEEIKKTEAVQKKTVKAAKKVNSTEATKDTLISNGGAYTLQYVLNNYNVFTSGNLQATHIVGPVAVGGTVSNGDGGAVNIGIQGYQHNAHIYAKGNAQALNFGNFIKSKSPVYLGLANTGVNTGREKVAFTDSYVDFSKAMSAFEKEALNFQAPVKITKAEIQSYRSKNPDQYTISNTYWRGAQINLKNGFSYELETMSGVGIINVDTKNKSGSVADVVIQCKAAETTSRFPLTKVDDQYIGGDEYNENGVGIVWLLPNISSINMVSDTFLGHIVAPNAKIEQEGGNYAGCVIAKSFKTKAEGHMWPYHGTQLIPADGEFMAYKTVDGKTPTDDQTFEFKFERISGPEGGDSYTKPVVVKNKGEKVDFGNITYTKEGIYYYKVTETASDSHGYQMDNSVYIYKVEVTSSVSGSTTTLSKTISIHKTGSADGIASGNKAARAAFNNVSKPTGEVGLKASKKLNGKDLTKGMFSFQVKEGNTVVATGTNDADGNIAFSKISYNEPGIHTYEISEVKENAGGITYDERKYTVKVTVKEEDGKLVAVPEYPDGEVEFTNTYKPEKTKIILEAKKSLTGKTLTEDMFEFEVKEGGIEVAKGTNDANGNIRFSPIEYEKEGNHTYTVTEKTGVQGGITYDTNSFIVNVSVTDDGEGKLTATPEYPKDEILFKNSYIPTSTKLKLEAQKTLEGEQLTAGMFKFEVMEGDQVVATGTNDAEGHIVFSEIKYDAAGHHKYTIKEKDDGLDGIKYDTTTFDVEVVVTDDGEGSLKAVPFYLDGSVSFVNRYEQKGAVEVTKDVTVNGEATGSSYADGVFYIGLFNNDGEQTGETKSIEIRQGVSGTAVFDNLVPGDYTVFEMIPDGKGGYEKGVPEGFKAVTQDGLDASGGIKVTVNGDSTTRETIRNDRSAQVGILKVYDSDLMLPLEGARLVLKDTQGNVVDSWTTGTETRMYEAEKVLKIGHTYILSEEQAPEGFLKADDITFTVTEEALKAGNGVLNIVMIDEPEDDYYRGTTETSESSTEYTEEETDDGDSYYREGPKTKKETVEKTEVSSVTETGDQKPMAAAGIIGGIACIGIVLILRKKKMEQ